jgi:hypothetical protein
MGCLHPNDGDVSSISELDELDRIANPCFSSEPYVAILRLRPAEVSAICNLSARAAETVSPVFVIPPPTTAGANDEELTIPLDGAMRSARYFLRRLCPRNEWLFPSPIAKIWLDCSYLDIASKKSTLDDLLSDRGIDSSKIVPVSHSHQSADHFARVSEHHRQFATGVMIRISINGFNLTEALKTATNSSILAKHVDLLIDCGFVSVQNVATTQKLAAQAINSSAYLPWRSISIVAGCIPEKFVFRDSQRAYQRQEIDIWRSAIDAFSRIRLGDYTTIAPNFLIGPPRSSLPNLRYSSGQQIYVIRRSKHPFSNLFAYHNICVTARAWQNYDLSASDWGSQQINDCAAGWISPLQRPRWGAVGIAHHIEVSSSQIRDGF